MVVDSAGVVAVAGFARAAVSERARQRLKWDAWDKLMSGAKSMLRDIEAEVGLTRHLIGRDRLSVDVLAAMQRVPRHDFVEPDMRRHAYINGPLPIGQGQTISQPYIVALMTDLAEPSSKSRVLEIGTGSGYQTAILAELVAEVYSIEIIPGLARAGTVRCHTGHRCRTGSARAIA